MFSALSPEYFMTDSKHNMQFKDTDGFVTWSLTPMVMMFAVNENTYEVEITFNPLIHHHLPLIFMLGHPRYSPHSSSNETEPRNCNKGTHTHTHTYIHTHTCTHTHTHTD